MKSVQYLHLINLTTFSWLLSVTSVPFTCTTSSPTNRCHVTDP